MAKWIKNNSGITKTYLGQQIANSTYYQIQSHEENAWAHHSPLITDIGNGDALVATDDSGNNDIIDVDTAINHLRDENPITINSASPVHMYALAEADNLRARLIGIHHNFTVTKNTTTNIDWAIPQLSYQGVNKKSYMDGIQYKAVDAVDGDKMSFQVIDIDNILGYGANTVLDEFGKDWPVVPNEKDTIRLYKAELITGLYIRIKYISIGTTNDVKLSVGLFRHMDTQ